MDKVLYKLENFEGPLDLLLHLITKNKVSIYDIPIVEITDQYLDAIAGFEESQLDNTSEFLVLAAQLLYIKSKMLLPKDEEDEEEEDPREDLARRLAEYQKFKEASMELRKSEFFSRYMFFKGEERIDFPIPQYDRKHDTSELLDAFGFIMQRNIRKEKPKKKAFFGIVGREKVSVDDMVEKVCKLLAKKRELNFKSIFKKTESKPERIATFLAVLEMIKLNKIAADYDELKRDFVIKSVKQTSTVKGEI
ncbi:MAG: segregation/condensation protein A [Clostridia bacterium]|nr:segregation/condensation protein A [Clostridia bacterium]